jgi:hypothetical protein
VGSWPWRALELGAPDISGTGSGSGSPRTTVSGHAQGRQGKREKGESGGGRLAGGPAQRVGQQQREKAGEVTAGGPARRGGPSWQGKRGRRGGCHAGPMGFKLQNEFRYKFQICSNLV